MSGRKLERVEKGIYRRGAGYVAIYQGPDGKPKKKAARTLEEARRVRRNSQTDVDRGDHPVGENPYLPAYIESWLETYSGRTDQGIRPETRAEYRRDLALYAEVFYAKTRIQDIDALSLKAFVRWVALGLRPSERGAPTRMLRRNTVRLAVAPLKLVLVTAAEEGLITRNPAIGMRLPLDLGDRYREDQGLDDDDENGGGDGRALSEKQTKALLAAVQKQEEARDDDDPMRQVDGLLLTELLLATGLRISEACGLEWRHFLPERARIQVMQRYREGNLSMPKNRKPRPVPLTPELVAKLTARRDAAAYGEVTDPIFTTRSGNYRRGSELLKKIMRPAADSIGLSWCGWHTLRHTCASMMFREGVNIRQVQEVLGHYSPAFTLAVYVHLIDKDLPENTWAAALSPCASKPREVRSADEEREAA